MIRTFQSPEEDGIGEGPHAFHISCLNSEVVHSVKVEIHNLMSKPITTDGLHNPVVDWYVLVQGVEQDVSCINRRVQILSVLGQLAALLLPHTQVSQMYFAIIIAYPRSINYSIWLGK